MKRFLSAYVRSTRPYYGFVTMSAGLAGAAAAPGPIPAWRLAATLAILYAGWGINQVLNDATNRREDAVNAPRRPMVTGELPLAPAVALSAAGIAAALVWFAVDAPAAVVPVAAGVALNLLYSKLKGRGLWGNLAFGCSIACAAWTGYAACGGGLDFAFAGASHRFAGTWTIPLVALSNAVMTTFTYFKDVEGDLAAGKRTVVGALGLRRAGRWLAAASLLPGIALLACGAAVAIDDAVRTVAAEMPCLEGEALGTATAGFGAYLALSILALVLFSLCGLRYAHGPRGAEAERGLGAVFAATVLASAAPAALRWPLAGALGALAMAAATAALYARTEAGRPRSLCGAGKWLLYGRVAASVLWRYRRRLSPRFVRRAAVLLLAFRHDRPVRLGAGWKLHLYLPAWPTPAFWRAVEDKLLADPPRPVSVVLSTTRACSFRCPHCYQRRDGGADLPQPDLLGVVEGLRRAGVAFLNVEGGDCFLDLPRLLAVCRAAGPDMEVWANTTGANVTPERLAAARDAGCAGIMVSMHGASAAAHDAFTGVPGAFEGARAALRAAAALGLGTAVNAVLGAADLDAGALDELLAEAGALGADYVQLIHPKRAGLWVGNEALDADERRLVAAVLRAHRRRNGWLRGAAGPALAAQAAEETPRAFGCTAGGIDRFYVGAAGDVQPCEFVNLSFGNVREEPFDAIFARMRAAFPVPREDWLCRSAAPAVAAWLARHPGAPTPLPPAAVPEILAALPPSPPTPIYRRMGLYAK